jgi:nucleoside-diphosphate-sugar epimerase
MVVGSGMVAHKFFDYQDKNIIFFASGVSNSNETNIESFKREETLLKDTLKKDTSKTFIYFSSCDVDNPMVNSKAYYQHKLNMEHIVSSSRSAYCIFRLPQVVGSGGNKNTLINFLIDRIDNKILFDVWLGTKKNIIDIDDVYTIVEHVIKNKKCVNSICNIINTKYISILDLVKIIEEKLNKKTYYTSQDLNVSYYYDSSCMKSILKELDLVFDDEYFVKLISKYAPLHFLIP